MKSHCVRSSDSCCLQTKAVYVPVTERERKLETKRICLDMSKTKRDLEVTFLELKDMQKQNEEDIQVLEKYRSFLLGSVKFSYYQVQLLPSLLRLHRQVGHCIEEPNGNDILYDVTIESVEVCILSKFRVFEALESHNLMLILQARDSIHASHNFHLVTNTGRIVFPERVIFEGLQPDFVVFVRVFSLKREKQKPRKSTLSYLRNFFTKKASLSERMEKMSNEMISCGFTCLSLDSFDQSEGVLANAELPLDGTVRVKATRKQYRRELAAKASLISCFDKLQTDYSLFEASPSPTESPTGHPIRSSTFSKGSEKTQASSV